MLIDEIRMLGAKDLVSRPSILMLFGRRLKRAGRLGVGGLFVGLFAPGRLALPPHLTAVVTWLLRGGYVVVTWWLQAQVGDEIASHCHHHTWC